MPAIRFHLNIHLSDYLLSILIHINYIFDHYHMLNNLMDNLNSYHQSQVIQKIYLMYIIYKIINYSMKCIQVLYYTVSIEYD